MPCRLEQVQTTLHISGTDVAEARTCALSLLLCHYLRGVNDPHKMRGEFCAFLTIRWDVPADQLDWAWKLLNETDNAVDPVNIIGSLVGILEVQWTCPQN